MSWFEEDPELLRAALEIIESWDGESSVNGVPVVSSPATEETDSANDDNDGEAGSEDGGDDLKGSPSPLRKPAVSITTTRTSTGRSDPTRELKPSTVSSTRHKRREEIIYLRDKVKEMENQLATLQTQKADGGDDIMTMRTNGVDAALAVMWQDIAGRQQKLRQKAELEQAKLKGLLETQMKVARGLIKLMQKAKRIEEDESFPTAKKPKLPINVSMGTTEEEQIARIEENYQGIEGAFRFSKFHDGTLKFIDVEVMDRSDDEVVIEFRDSWALPFDVTEVMDAMWTYMGRKMDEKVCPAKSTTVVSVAENMFSAHFTATANVGSLKGRFDGKAMNKRFPATHERGPAILWNMFSEPHPGAMENMFMQEDGWLRVLPARSLSKQPDSEALAVVQSNRRFRLTFDSEASPTSRRNAGVLTDFLLDQLTQEIQFKHETVETLLLNTRS